MATWGRHAGVLAGLCAFVGITAYLPFYLHERQQRLTGNLYASDKPLSRNQSMRGPFINSGSRDVGPDPDWDHTTGTCGGAPSGRVCHGSRSSRAPSPQVQGEGPAASRSLGVDHRGASLPVGLAAGQPWPLACANSPRGSAGQAGTRSLELSMPPDPLSWASARGRCERLWASMDPLMNTPPWAWAGMVKKDPARARAKGQGSMAVPFKVTKRKEDDRKAKADVAAPTKDKDAARRELTPEQRTALREFDLDAKFGPCAGITRLERWERAHELGLDPPVSVKSILASARDRDPKANRSVFSHL